MTAKPDTMPDRSKRKLGRGLGALLGETQREESIQSSGDCPKIVSMFHHELSVCL